MSSSSLVTGAAPLGCIASSQPGHRTTGKLSGASLPILPHDGQEQKRSIQGPDTEAQDPVSPLLISACNVRPVHTVVPMAAHGPHHRETQPRRAALIAATSI